MIRKSCTLCDCQNFYYCFLLTFRESQLIFISCLQKTGIQIRQLLFHFAQGLWFFFDSLLVDDHRIPTHLSMSTQVFLPPVSSQLIPTIKCSLPPQNPQHCPVMLKDLVWIIIGLCQWPIPLRGFLLNFRNPVTLPSGFSVASSRVPDIQIIKLCCLFDLFNSYALHDMPSISRN